MASKYNIRKTLIDTLKSWSEGANHGLFLSSTTCSSTIASQKKDMSTILATVKAKTQGNP